MDEAINSESASFLEAASYTEQRNGTENHPQFSPTFSENYINEDELIIEVTEAKDNKPVKTFDDLKILLQVLKKHFATICPECIDALYDAMLSTATRVSCPNPCCDYCSDFFRTLSLQIIMERVLRCTGSCPQFNPTCVPFLPRKQCCYSCLPSKSCTKVCYCSRPISRCLPSPCCSPGPCCSSSPCCSPRKRKLKPKRCPSSMTDRYKPKSVLVDKQKYLRKQIRKVKQRIECCKRCCCPRISQFTQTNLDNRP